MVLEYELVHDPPLPRGVTTADVSVCRFQFDFEQVQAAIVATVNSHLADARRPGGIQLRDDLARFGMSLIIARREGTTTMVVCDVKWRCWTWVFRHLRSTRAFHTASCEMCQHVYAASTIQAEPFQVTGCGGTRYRCPIGHLLYADWEWIS
jgi:hypothetical protein